MENVMNHLGEIKSFMGEFGKEMPDLMKHFGGLNKEAFAEGTLDVKTKKLISIGVAISERCESCLAMHIAEAVQAGTTDKEIAETIGVAVMMGGGPALMYGMRGWEMLKQLRG